MRAARWSPVVLAVLFLVGCGQTQRQTHGSTLYLTAKDFTNKVITVKRHTTIVVALASNPSTGFSWAFNSGSSPTEPLRLVSHRYVPPKQRVPGAAGTEIWRFRAVGYGALPIGFAYRRSWQPEKIARHLGVSIEVS